MKKLLFLVILMLGSLSLKAQYNYSDWAFGFNISSIKGYTDVSRNKNTYSAAGQVYYNFTPYIPLGLELQVGRLKGGDDILDPYHRYFTNNFKALILHGDLQLGEIVDYQNSFVWNTLKGLYLGAGFGVISNNISDNRRYDKDNPSYMFPGVDHSINTLVSIRGGYEFKIFNYDDEPFMAINIGYVHNVTFGEGLDGYNDPPTKFKNNVPDMFRQITVGVKFSFGGNVKSYVKPIH